MQRAMMLGLLLTSLTVCGLADERPEPPHNREPRIVLAKADAIDGKVVVTLTYPRTKVLYSLKATFTSWDEAKRVEHVWEDVKVTLDDKIKVLNVQGEAIEPKSLLTKLSKPTHVAVFMEGIDGAAPEAHPFYLEALRPDLVVFVGSYKRLNP